MLWMPRKGRVHLTWRTWRGFLEEVAFALISQESLGFHKTELGEKVRAFRDVYNVGCLIHSANASMECTDKAKMLFCTNVTESYNNVPLIRIQIKGLEFCVFPNIQPPAHDIFQFSLRMVVLPSPCLLHLKGSCYIFNSHLWLHLC